MSWAYKILILIGGFILMILGFVYVSLKQSNPMVDENYYEQELLFQSKIEGAKEFANLEQKLKLSSEGNDLILNLAIPNGKIIQEGYVRFIHLQDPKSDFDLNLKSNSETRIKIPEDRIQKGRYLVKAGYTCDSKYYYVEEYFNL